MERLYLEVELSSYDILGDKEIAYFKDIVGNRYVWRTNNPKNDIAVLIPSRWYRISGTLKGYDSNNIAILTNVRLLKKERIDD